jgi:MFS superfamily sulfate permease-like transporter
MENKLNLLNKPLGRASRPRGLKRWIPGLGILGAYKADWLFKDFFAGLVLTAILVPVGMGYAF